MYSYIGLSYLTLTILRTCVNRDITIIDTTVQNMLRHNNMNPSIISETFASDMDELSIVDCMYLYLETGS